MKKRVSPGDRRAIILIQARSISRLETAFGRCDLVELANRTLCRGVGEPRGLCVGDRDLAVREFGPLLLRAINVRIIATFIGGSP